MEAGLPNITGVFGLRTPLNTSDMTIRLSGAFSYTTEANGTAGAASGEDFNGRIHLDASRSSKVYGSSTTVTPLSESTLLCIRY